MKWIVFLLKLHSSWFSESARQVRSVCQVLFKGRGGFRLQGARNGSERAYFSAWRTGKCFLFVKRANLWWLWGFSELVRVRPHNNRCMLTAVTELSECIIAVKRGRKSFQNTTWVFSKGNALNVAKQVGLGMMNLYDRKGVEACRGKYCEGRMFQLHLKDDWEL